jgi:RimJ/RimL family protein N-acetyltransferase
MTGMSLPTPTLPTPTLHTARLRLRPFDDADANDLFALHSSAYVLRYWDAPPWSERVRAERFITACRQIAEGGTGARLAVDRVSDGAFIGWCSLNRWNPDYRSASPGYRRPVRPAARRSSSPRDRDLLVTWERGAVRGLGAGPVAVGRPERAWRRTEGSS